MSKAGDDLTGTIIWPTLEARYVVTLSKAKINQESKYTLSTIKGDPLTPIKKDLYIKDGNISTCRSKIKPNNKQFSQS